MILVDDVTKHLIDKLAEAYPKPARWQAFAVQVVENCGEWVTGEDLDALAKRIIATRRSKTFPDIPTLIAAVRTIQPRTAGGTKRKPGKVEMIGGVERRFGGGQDAERLKALDEAEERAMSFLRGRPLAERAVAERWGPALIGFAIKHGREPQADEEIDLIALSRQNDVDARDLEGPLAPAIQNLRATMHEAAARRLMSEG